jgi:ABC-type sugar transport system permease subunit
MTVADTSQPRREATWARLWEKLTPSVFISPFFLVFLAFMLIPIAFSLFLSLARWDGMRALEFVGLQNFVDMFHDKRFWNAMRVTLTITVTCTIVGPAGSLFLAVLLDKVGERIAGWLRAIFFLPSVTSAVVITYIWKQLYSADYGYFNAFLQQLGLPEHQWLLDPRLVVPAIIVMLIWAGLGWDALIFSAGLKSIPKELYDQAKIDGAGDWAEFWHVTFPLLRSYLLFVLVTSVIFLLGIFAQIQLMTGGEPMHASENLSLYLYQSGFQYHKFGYASAIAVVLTIMMFVGSWLNFRFVPSGVEY